MEKNFEQFIELVVKISENKMKTLSIDLDSVF